MPKMEPEPTIVQTPQPVRAGKPLAVYIHWPFCKSKCPYCDFNSHVREGVDQSRWRDALITELNTMASKIGKHTVTSIFFGGGTPSLMPPSTAQALIDRVHALWPVAEDVEITLEANPTSVETSTFADFRRAGINRASLGVQSFDNEALRFLGRGHNAGEAMQAIDLARATFDRYSFDLIYARPQQSLSQWEKELTEAMAYVGNHLSLYQLTIEENTAFHHAYAKGGFTLPDEAEAEALYRLTESLLAGRGLIAYEVSNYARAGEESRHNLAYWQGVDYIGIGPGAHGRVSREKEEQSADCASVSPQASQLHNGLPLVGQPSPMRGSADPQRGHSLRIATQTLKSPERWLEQVERGGHALEVWEPVEQSREVQERVMMGLRLREGISYQQFSEQSGFDLKPYLNAGRCEYYKTKGLLADRQDRLQATLNGRLVLNTLTAELLN